MEFLELTEGDRFLAHNALWTKIAPDTARKHSQESQAMGDRGYGYIGDSICTFDLNDPVIFVPPTQGEDHTLGCTQRPRIRADMT